MKYGDRVWTWREHVAEASDEAAALIALADPDRPLHVGALLGNTPDMLRAMAAAGLGGYVLCGINTTRRGAGLLADVRRAECQLLVTDAEHRHLLEGVDLTGVRVLDTSTQEWADLLAQHAVGAGELVPHREVEAMDTFMMIFTSGTSGDPKAVQVAHLMVLFSGLNLVERFAHDACDVCYLVDAAVPLQRRRRRLGGRAGERGCDGAGEVLGVELPRRRPALRRRRT